MYANELRIGNLLQSQGNIGKVIMLSTTVLGCILQFPDGKRKHIVESDNSSIPITEEWLIELGFEKVDVNLFEKRCLTLFIENGTWKWFLGDRAYKIGTEIKYVHTLQNLYFALTDEELTIK